MTDVLILDGDTRAALAAVRALGRDGKRAAVASVHESCLAGNSKYCSRVYCSPCPLSQTDDYANWLTQLVKSERIIAVLPTSDVTASLLYKLNSETGMVSTIAPSMESFNQAVDKWSLLKIAENAGMSIPRSILLTQNDDLQKISSDLGWPIVLKPRFSADRVGGHFVRRDVRVVRTSEEFSQVNSEMSAAGDVIAQQYVSGVGVGIFFLFKEGECIVRFAHRRIREKPPTGGVSVVSESILLPSGLTSQAEGLLRAIDWNGVAMVEFRQNETMYYLMEVNARLWGSVQLAISAGVNFPVIMVRIAEQAALPESSSYECGIRNRWLLGDLDNLLMQIFRSDPKLTWSQMMLAVRDFLRLGGRKQSFEVFQFGDPGPFRYELKQYFADLFRKR